jgi:hypothetical protein
MKTTAHLLLAALVATSAQPCAALDFRLKSLAVADLDGATTDFYFDDSGKRVFYRPPPRWQLEQSADRLVMRPPEPMSGEVTIETGKSADDLAPPGTDDRAALEGYETLARSLLAKDAKNAKVFESVTGLFGGRELPVTRIAVSYDLGGQQRCATFCFVLYKPDEVLRITIKSLEQDYSPVHGTALHSLEAFTPEP